MLLLRADSNFSLVAHFLLLSGFGMWVMQASNLITGKWLETGEHVRILLLPWLAFASLALGVLLWQRRALFSRHLQYGLVAIFGVLALANAYFFNQYFSPFLNPYANEKSWQERQLYAGPFTWLEEHEPEPVVVWSNPNDVLATHLPIFTRHFVLYAYWGILELVPDSEVRERYLISQYFNNPNEEDLKRDLANYVGRQVAFHNAKTIERGIKICRLLFFWDSGKDCGTLPTSVSLLGEQFFVDLEKQFKDDIKPNIKTYLKKYHVTYILKDMMLDTRYLPKTLGATRVYEDGRFELWKLP
jgi:hypothetical protein